MSEQDEQQHDDDTAEEQGEQSTEDGQESERTDGSDGSDDDGEDLDKVKAMLSAERRKRRSLEGEITKLKRGQMNDSERAIAEAKESGRLEARKESAGKIAESALKAAAAGKVPTEVIAEINADKFVTDDGDVDTQAIDATIARLAKAAPSVRDGKVPAGPRAPAESSDWLRDSAAAAARG